MDIEIPGATVNISQGQQQNIVLSAKCLSKLLYFLLFIKLFPHECNSYQLIIVNLKLYYLLSSM